MADRNRAETLILNASDMSLENQLSMGDIGDKNHIGDPDSFVFKKWS